MQQQKNDRKIEIKRIDFSEKQKKIERKTREIHEILKIDKFVGI